MRERVTVRSSGWLQIHVGANLLHRKFAAKLLIGHLNLQNEVTCLDLKHNYFVTIVIGLTVTGGRKQCSAHWQKSTLFLPWKINLCWSNLRLTFLVFALGQSQTPQQCFFRKSSVPMHTSFLVWWKSIFFHCAWGGTAVFNFLVLGCTTLEPLISEIWQFSSWQVKRQGEQWRIELLHLHLQTCASSN